MTHALPPAPATRLEKAAVDNGFDLTRSAPPGWLGFASTHAPLELWLTSVGDVLIAAFSQVEVAQALATYGSVVTSPLPERAVAAVGVTDNAALHTLVRRAFQLARALPDAPLRVFQTKTQTLPKSTEAERLVIQRVGQDIFRGGLIDYWEGRCAITGLAVPELLRASHIKPWADCESDAERLDVFNGLLLAPHLDAAFDHGFITVEDDGAVRISPQLDEGQHEILNIHKWMRVMNLADGHRVYLPWHREHVFRRHAIAKNQAPNGAHQ